MLSNELPESVKDLPYIHSFKGKKIWSVLDEGHRISATFEAEDSSIVLRAELSPVKAELLLNKQQANLTAVSNGTRVSLMRCHSWETPFSRLINKDKSQVRVSPSFMVVHPDDKKVPEFITNLTGHLPGLGEWLEEDFLEFDYKEYKFKQPKTIYHKISIGPSISVSLSSRLAIDTEKAIIEKEFRAYPESFVKIDFVKPVSINTAVGVFSQVEEFFNFVFSQPHSTHILSSQIQKPGKNKKVIYFHYPHRQKLYKSKESQRSSNLLFRWSDISDIDGVFMRWLREYDSLHEIIDTLVLLKFTRISQEIRFTATINALEAVHRRYYDHKIEPNDTKFNDRVNNIIDSLSKPDDKKLVKEKLFYANEISLRTRLKEIYLLGEAYGVTKPSKRITDKIIITRNYFTHGDEKQRDKILNSSELGEANRLLAKYLKLLLLTILGVKKNEMIKIVKESDQFKPLYWDGPDSPYLLSSIY